MLCCGVFGCSYGGGGSGDGGGCVVVVENKKRATTLTHVSARNFQSEHFDCANKFAFRKSAINPPPISTPPVPSNIQIDKSS